MAWWCAVVPPPQSQAYRAHYSTIISLSFSLSVCGFDTAKKEVRPCACWRKKTPLFWKTTKNYTNNDLCFSAVFFNFIHIVASIPYQGSSNFQEGLWSPHRFNFKSNKAIIYHHIHLSHSSSPPPTFHSSGWAKMTYHINIKSWCLTFNLLFFPSKIESSNQGLKQS